MDIKLTPATEKRLHGAIQRFVAEEYGESVGELGAGTFLTFCLKELGPAIYNQAIADAQSYFADKTADLSGVRFEPEFDFWKKR